MIGTYENKEAKEGRKTMKNNVEEEEDARRRRRIRMKNKEEECRIRIKKSRKE